MKITICNRVFDQEQIRNIIITKERVLIDAYDNFYNLVYDDESEIQEAMAYLRFKNVKFDELMDAIILIITTCEQFLSHKTQCLLCPLKKNEGCIFNNIPIDWRN